MAFAGLHPADGPFVLSDGSSLRIWITREGGQDLGAQWAQPNSIGPATLQVGEFAKERRPDPGGRSFTVLYWCTVTNIGGFPALFDLTGGGNV
jgi:hypothetical protein